MNNALTIDLEYWWCNEFLTNYLPDKKEDFIESSVEIILTLLSECSTYATFFVLGEVAESHPEVIKKIYDEGHEIASHAYHHKILSKISKSDFDNELLISTNIITKLTGSKPKGFRAPNFSVNNSNKWVFEVLEKYNYIYDSSIFPLFTGLYGVNNAPVLPYKISKQNIVLSDVNGKIWEIPPSVFSVIGMKIPISGGFYLRTLPLSIIKRGINILNKSHNPFILYVHPWEINPVFPKLSVPLISYFISYNGLNTTYTKLKNIIKQYKFSTMESIINDL